MTTPQQIVPLLREASHAYYNGAPLKMSDEAYDGLLERLRELDPEHPYLEEVGAPPPATGAVKLPYPMPSLDKIKPGEDQLKRFLSNPGGFVLSEKLDGLSALWHKGKLYLRGDGLVGQDVSHIVALGIQGLVAVDAAVRGELILPRSERQALARSWVNGQLHQKTPDPAEIDKIRFVAYEIMASNLKRSVQFQWLQAHGFELPWFSVISPMTEMALATILQDRRQISPYDTDGIVVGLDTVPKSESTAAKAKNPKDCVAFKMPLADQSAETTVREVLWAPSPQGYLIPRVRFDPVRIGAATIEFCTGHNAKMIRALGVGPGAKIVIRRSGDVIPKLDRVICSAEPSFPPENTWEWIGSAESANHIRSTQAGDAETTAKLHHFLKTISIPGCGPATATALVKGGVHTVRSLWETPATKLSELLGPKTGAALHTNLRSTLSSIDEITLMVASSKMPRTVGETKLTTLFAAETNPGKWGVHLKPAGWTADSLEQFLSEFPKYMEWRKTQLSWIPFPSKKEAGHSAASVLTPIESHQPAQVICMTGFRDKELEAESARRGHTFASNVTKKTTLLLVPDGEVKESEKVKAAKTYGIRCLGRTAFIQQYLTRLE